MRREQDLRQSEVAAVKEELRQEKEERANEVEQVKESLRHEKEARVHEIDAINKQLRQEQRARASDAKSFSDQLRAEQLARVDEVSNLRKETGKLDSKLRQEKYSRESQLRQLTDQIQVLERTIKELRGENSTLATELRCAKSTMSKQASKAEKARRLLEDRVTNLSSVVATEKTKHHTNLVALWQEVSNVESSVSDLLDQMVDDQKTRYETFETVHQNHDSVADQETINAYKTAQWSMTRTRDIVNRQLQNLTHHTAFSDTENVAPSTQG